MPSKAKAPVKKKMTPTAAKKARSAAAHRTRVKATYGLTGEEYQALLDAQGGVCAICGGKRTYRLNVDHCHKDNIVRGLLCRTCNGRMLPAAKDNPETLRKAARYLEEAPAWAIIGKRPMPEQPLKAPTRRPRFPKNKGGLTHG